MLGLPRQTGGVLPEEEIQIQRSSASLMCCFLAEPGRAYLGVLADSCCSWLLEGLQVITGYYEVLIALKLDIFIGCLIGILN